MAFAGFFTLAEMTVEVAGHLWPRRTSPPERRGTYLALFGCCFGVGYGTSPIVAGLLLDSRLPHNVIWPGQLATATLATAGLLVLARLRKRQ